MYIPPTNTICANFILASSFISIFRDMKSMAGMTSILISNFGGAAAILKAVSNLGSKSHEYDQECGITIDLLVFLHTNRLIISDEVY
jgi:hypothetical protein